MKNLKGLFCHEVWSQISNLTLIYQKYYSGKKKSSRCHSLRNASVKSHSNFNYHPQTKSPVLCSSGWLGGGSLCPGGLCLGGVSVQGILSMGFCPGGSLSRGFCPWGSVQGGLCPGGLCPEGLCPGGLCLEGGLCPGGLCSGGLCWGDPPNRDPLYAEEQAVRILIGVFTNTQHWQ